MLSVDYAARCGVYRNRVCSLCADSVGETEQELVFHLLSCRRATLKARQAAAAELQRQRGAIAQGAYDRTVIAHSDRGAAEAARFAEAAADAAIQAWEEDMPPAVLEALALALPKPRDGRRGPKRW